MCTKSALLYPTDRKDFLKKLAALVREKDSWEDGMSLLPSSKCQRQKPFWRRLPAWRGLCLYSCVDENVSNSEVWIQAHSLPPTGPVKMHRRPPSLPQSLPWAQGHKPGGSCPLKALGLWPHPSSSPAVWGAIAPNTSDLWGEPKHAFLPKVEVFIPNKL